MVDICDFEFTGVWEPFGASEEAAQSDKSSQVMSLESASIGAKDYKFETEKIYFGVWE